MPTEQVQRAATLTNVLYEKKGPIAYVTLNRPKVLNALSQGACSKAVRKSSQAP